MTQPEKCGEETMPAKPRWFGRGIYGSKDVPIRILDGVIAGMIVLAIVLTIVFSVNGGYVVAFDTSGGSEVPSQKLRYGSYAEDPGIPLRVGYEFEGWYYGVDLQNPWYFPVNKVTEDVTLTARWTAAEVLVKFDLNGGHWKNHEVEEDFYVTFGAPYGALPIPEKSGASFDGWQYGGQVVTSDTIMNINGEHVLTALWRQLDS